MKKAQCTGVCRLVRGDPVGIGHRLAKLWGFCGGSGRPGTEHQAPQLLELMATFRVTQRHWVAHPAGMIPRRTLNTRVIRVAPVLLCHTLGWC
jgi:hypothetical protein